MKMEIVSPAGDYDKLKAAIKGGADAVYLGLEGFGARRNAKNFSIDELIEAIDYAHLRGVKLYLTLNTIFKDIEIEGLFNQIKKLYKAGIDAVIVQDFGMINFLKENFPLLELHGSTQMTVTNHVEANYLKNIGLSRVVPARELTFSEIKSIKEKSDIELEIFVSGALCISYSGNCYLSSFTGGRSGNRGICAQPCRRVYKSDKNDEEYFLSPKDQWLEKEEIDKLLSIGVESVKIEGRMKSESYVYSASKFYANLVNGIDSEAITKKIFNRGYSKGYFYNGEKLMNSNYSSDLGYKIATVSKSKEVILEEELSLGDGVVYLDKTYNKLGGDYINKILDISGNKLTKGKIGQKIKLSKLPPKTVYIHKNFDKKLQDKLSSSIKTSDKKIDIRGKIDIIKDKELSLTFNYKNIEAKISLDKLEEAKKQIITNDIIFEKISELGNTSFNLEKLDINFDNKAFVSLKMLKSIKRDAAELLKSKIIEFYKKEHNGEIITYYPKEKPKKNPEIVATVINQEQEKIVKEFGIKKVYYRNADVAKEESLDKIDLNNPLAGNLYQLLLNKNDEVTLDWNINIMNSYALRELSKIKKLKTVYLSPELSDVMIEDITSEELRKGIVIYGYLRAMYIEKDIISNDVKVIKNSNNDKLRIFKNSLGNTEVYYSRAFNLIPELDSINELGLDEVRLDFTFESEDEVLKILNSLKDRSGMFIGYNFHKGID